MKLMNKLSLTTLSLSILGGAILSPVVASANSNYHSQYVESKHTRNYNHISSSFNQDLNTSVLNKYIHVENNQFVLKLPNNLKISYELKSEALSELSVTNSIIKNQNLTIDPNTLTATNTFNVDDSGNVSYDNDGLSFRSYGRTGIIKVRWNFIRLGFDAGLTKDILSAGVAGLSGYLTFLAKGPKLASIVSAVSGFVGNHISYIKHGTYIDYNPILQRITRVGWQ